MSNDQKIKIQKKQDQKFSSASCFLAFVVIVYLVSSTLQIFFDLPFLRQPSWLPVVSMVLVLTLATLLRHLSLVVRVNQAALLGRPSPPQTLCDGDVNPASLGTGLSACLVIDEDGAIVGCNAAFSELTGHARSVLVGVDMADFLVPEHCKEAFRASLEDQMRFGDGGGLVGDLAQGVMLCSDGTEMPVELTVDRVRESEQSYFLAAIRDRRQRRSIEQDLRVAKVQAEAANRAKSRFLAAMSHEIRTLLNALLGAVSLIRGNLSNEESKNLLETAKQSGDLLASVVNDILDYSKIEAGEMTLDNKPFSAVQRVNEAVDLYQVLARKKGIKIVAVCDPQCAEYVLGDPSKFSQILNNLIANAIKFTESGVVTVNFEPIGLAPGGGEYRLSVRDTGIGIAAEHLDSVFDVFAQYDESNERRSLGVGLGLAISRQLALLMGGDISVSSRLGLGSVFRLQLVLEPSEAPPARKIRRDQSTAGAETLPILLVEDSPANQQVVGLALRRAGYTVTITSDGIEARAQLRHHGPFSLVLSDIRMPRMDGLELARWIRQAGIMVPVIGLSAKNFKEDEAACLAAGMNALLTKPIDFELLECTVAEWIDLASRWQQADADLVRALGKSFLADDEFAAALQAVQKELRDLEDRLRDAASRQDFVELDRVIHRLNGIAKSYQLRNLRQTCVDLEKVSGEQRWDFIGLLGKNVSSLLDGLKPWEFGNY